MNPTEEQPKKKSGIANRGFASMNKEKHIEIASKGGKKISANREHMAEIGRKGGEVSGFLRRRKQQNLNENNQSNPPQ